MRLRAAIALVFSFAAASAAPVVIRDHDHLALAPRGDRVADVEALDPGNLADDPHGQVVLRDMNGKVLGAYDPCRTCRYASTQFSPDGSVLAFVGSDARAHAATLYAVEKGKTRVLAAVQGIANTVRYSRDGAQIALLVTIGAKKMAGAVEAGAAQVGEIGEGDDEQRIAVLPAKGGALRLVSPGDTYVYEFDWMPDGSGFVATAAKGNGDNNWWVATLDFIDAKAGSLRVIAAPRLQIELPRVSPDGGTVAFIGGLMSDWQSIGGDVYSVPVAGGEPVDLTPGFDATFRSIDWRNGEIRATALKGDCHVFLGILPDGKLDEHGGGGDDAKTPDACVPGSIRGQGVDSSVVYSADGGSAAFIHEDFNRAPQIWTAHFWHLTTRALPDENDALAENVSAESIHWTNEGFRLQGWLVGPKETQPGRKYPMVVIVHGGPSSAFTPRYVAAGGQHGSNFDFAYDLVRKGYFIFYPNDRGSYGQGEAFTRANVEDFGRGDMRDMLAGVDQVEKIAPIDDGRLGLYGHSYGGWFSMWANTQTRRFKAFVAGAGIANWTSYYGQNGIDQWMIPFFGASVYDDPQVYRAASPIEFIKSAKTPMLLYVGERDVECPAAQSLEYWHALKTMGTEVSLFIYAGEGHHFRKQSNLVDLRGRIIGWFDGHLK